jgi:hypothetical protein
VTISGTGFTGTTSVTFNGLPATFTLSGDSQLAARVPAGATTGPVVVTTKKNGAATGPAFTVAVLTPSVTTLAPAGGAAGAWVTIRGSSLTGTSAVSFNGVPATFAVVSDSQLSAQVPVTATSGPLTVTTPGGTATAPFTVLPPPPAITGLSAASGLPGASVTLAGSHLTGATAVTFNGVPATFVFVSDAELTAQVPAGATSGPVQVTTPSGTAVGGTFVVLGPPAVTGFSPGGGRPGTSVAITGTHLAGATAVTFNGVPAAFSVVSDTLLSAQVPPGATTGVLAVTTPLGTALGATAYTVAAGRGNDR